MRVAFAIAAATLLAAAAVTAQQPPLLHEQVTRAIDTPAPGGPVPAKDPTITGWAFYCSTGEHPLPRPTVQNLDTNTAVDVTARWWFKDHLERTDVYGAYRGACPKVHQYEGYELHLPALPPGHYRVTITWDDDAIARNIDVRDITAS